MISTKAIPDVSTDNPRGFNTYYQCSIRLAIWWESFFKDALFRIPIILTQPLSRNTMLQCSNLAWDETEDLVNTQRYILQNHPTYIAPSNAGLPWVQPTLKIKSSIKAGRSRCIRLVDANSFVSCDLFKPSLLFLFSVQWQSHYHYSTMSEYNGTLYSAAPPDGLIPDNSLPYEASALVICNSLFFPVAFIFTAARIWTRAKITGQLAIDDCKFTRSFK